ncbi:hypothetical protein CDD83_4247 [Cordyceps sp. RAO-2017]|nr:hypothetical protein CDD83_4247 [Cordyceps sp. RAO-2017]
MSFQGESHELGHVSQVKAIRPHVEEAPSSAGRRDLDREQLEKLGKKSVLKRNFRFLTILGFSCAVLVTWEGATITYGLGLKNGGPAGLIYGFIFIWIGNISVFATLCELISIAPTCGGQYHWVAMLAPKSSSKFLSYITGWLTLAGWQGAAASSGFFNGKMIQGLIIFLSATYQPENWHAVMLLWLVILIVLVMNTVISSMLPKIEGVVLILHIVGFFAVLITLFTFGQRQDAASVFVEFNNGGNWSSQALSVFVGLAGCAYSFAGVDCSFHMCEEVENPSAAVPRSIMTSVLINGAMGLSMIIALLYGTTDLEKAMESTTGYPFMEIFYQATGSVGGTAAMICLVIFMSVCCTVGLVAATSRMCWAFSRDRGLPFWRALSKVGTWTCVPVWAIAATSLISCLLGLITLGSKVVFEALVSVTISGLYSSYLIAAILLLYRRCGKGYKDPDPSVLPDLVSTASGQGQELAWGPWHIPGVAGIVNNAFACVFLSVTLFFSFWPPQTPVEPETMNFCVLVTGGVVLFSTAYYLAYARHAYKGPIREVHDDFAEE